MMEKQNDYGVQSFNIKDSVGEFTYKVRLSDHIDFDPDTGFLYCKDAVVGNVGVQVYKGCELGFSDGNRIVKVHRIEEHIFADKSLESLRGKPITLNHPTEMIDSNNVKKYGMGTVLDVGKRDGDNIIVDLVIQDKELIDKVAPEDDNGERHLSDDFRDLSLGYTAKLLPYKDTNDYVQTNIHYNHLAVVREGRAANAMIVDAKNDELKGAKMSLKEKLKGLFIKKNADNTVVVQDEETKEEQVVSVEEFHEKRSFQDPMEHDKTITVETKSETVVKEKDGPDAIVKKDEDEKEDKEDKGEKKMKDRAYFDAAMKEAMALPEGAYRDGVIQGINEEYAVAFPKPIKDAKPVEVKDSALAGLKPVASEIIDKAVIKDEQPKQIDFAFMERESKEFYDKISNPESAHFKNHAEQQAFYNETVRSGRTNLNA